MADWNSSMASSSDSLTLCKCVLIYEKRIFFLGLEILSSLFLPRNWGTRIWCMLGWIPRSYFSPLEIYYCPRRIPDPVIDAECQKKNFKIPKFSALFDIFVRMNGSKIRYRDTCMISRCKQNFEKSSEFSLCITNYKLIGPKSFWPNDFCANSKWKHNCPVKFHKK